MGRWVRPMRGALVPLGYGLARAPIHPDRGALAEALVVATVLFVPLHLLEPYFVTTGMPHLWWAPLGLAMAERNPR